MKCQCRALKNVGRVVPFVTECPHYSNRHGKWFTYGVVIREGHPLSGMYVTEEEELYIEKFIGTARLVTSYGYEFDGLTLPYKGTWFASNSYGEDISYQEALRRAIDLAQQLDVM